MDSYTAADGSQRTSLNLLARKLNTFLTSFVRRRDGSPDERIGS